jgi:proteasome lid subunit RPN8/RPN11
MHALTLDRAVYDDLIAHAGDGNPEEVCGVLGGSRGDAESHAATARRAENAAESPRTRYALDPAEQLALMDDIDDDGRDVVGFYHSHPAGPPRPSETDAAQAAWPGYSYVIVDLSGASPYVGSWRWTGAEFEQEPVRLA